MWLLQPVVSKADDDKIQSSVDKCGTVCRQVNGRNDWDGGRSCVHRNPVPSPGTGPRLVGTGHVLRPPAGWTGRHGHERPRGFQRGRRPPRRVAMTADQPGGGVRIAERGKQDGADPHTCIGRRSLFCPRGASPNCIPQLQFDLVLTCYFVNICAAFVRCGGQVICKC